VVHPDGSTYDFYMGRDSALQPFNAFIAIETGYDVVLT
jgi:hypothetical protein